METKYILTLKDSYKYKDQYPEKTYDVDELDFKHKIVRFSTHNIENKYCFNICVPFEDADIKLIEI